MSKQVSEEQQLDVFDSVELKQVEVLAGEIDDSEFVGDEQGQVIEKKDNAELKQALSLVLVGGFSVLAPNWKVSEDECKSLAECYALVLDKYFPDASNAFGCEVSAIMLTAGVVGSRVVAGIPRKEKTKELEHKGADDVKAS